MKGTHIFLKRIIPMISAPGGFTYEEIKYHVVLLGESGYIKTIDYIGVKEYALPKRLTMKGHLYLEGIRKRSLKR